MTKLNIFHPYLHQRYNKKYLVFLFIIVTILVYGFLFTKVQAEEVSGEIITNTTWSKSKNPYVIIDSITVAGEATLTIEPGTIVKFDSGAVLIIDGKIEANGTESEPIYFTSNYDDEVGGNTNKDSEDYEDCSYDDDGNVLEGTCKIIDLYQPSLGDWEYILLESPTEQSILNNVIQKYSNDGLVVYNKASVVSNNFDSDNNILTFGSHSSFERLTVPSISLYEGSNISIRGSTISNKTDLSISVEDGSSLNVANSKIEGSDYYYVSVYGGSSAIFDTVEMNGDEIGVWDDSSLKIDNSSITSKSDGLQIFQNSTLTATDLSVSCENDGIAVFNNSSLELSKGNIFCKDNGIYIFDESNAKIDKVKINGVPSSNYYSVGLMAHGNSLKDAIKINNSEITGNKEGFIVYNSDISAHQNSIHDNTVSGVTTYDNDSLTSYSYDFSLNYWGDKTGPKNISTNLDGLGNEVSDNILFNPFLKSDPTKDTKNPIIIIPGIMGTKLIRDYGDKDEIWPSILRALIPGPDSYLNDLSLLFSGEENYNFPIKTGDIIRNIAGNHIFDNLIIELINNGGYVENENLFVLPYDWRFSNTKNSELLKEKINQIITSSGKDKVDIVAHSMGGLLTKEYIKESGKEKIDHLVFLGTPHLGAPKAFKSLVYGDDMGVSILIGILGIKPERVKSISQNMPSIYELLPSRKYVSSLRYISEKTIGRNPTYLDYDATSNLLIDKGTNQSLVKLADTFHNDIDDIDLFGIKVSNISACGEATLSAIDIRKKTSIGPFSLGEDYKLAYANGDGTVPLDSSFGISNVNKYFVDKVGHSALPSAPDVPSALLNILGDKVIPTESRVFEDVAKCTPIKGVILSIHSPISLDIYDTNGNHAGLDINGEVENNISGVSYDTIGEAKFAFIPDGLDVNVKGSATSSGSFDLAVEKVVDSKTVETKFWNDVSIVSTTKMNFDFNSYEDVNSIELDNGGQKTDIPNSNTLSKGDDYLAITAKDEEVINSHRRGGSYFVYNPRSSAIVPKLEIKNNILPDVIKKVNIKKQKPINKSLVLASKKENIINKGTTIPASNLGASVINSGQGIDLWGTIRSFFIRLFHIKK